MFAKQNAVHFISTSTGNIQNYLWDYGDATSTLQNSDKVFDCSTTMMNPFSCSKNVSLTVIDIYGCSNSVSMNQLVRL